ncbi:MAG: response regulator [Deltaproteobacteria bacterium]|nr:response regulator [Deltaproteobacteria bacterium]
MASPPRILIVDDEKMMCDSLHYLLNREPYEVFKAYDGEQAIRMFSEDIYDLVLLDVVLPDMDGYAVMDALSRRSSETLIIIMTGYATMDSAIDAIRRGAYDYLRKPFEHQELLRTIENALNHKRLKAEKKALDGMLELSEERYRYLVQNSPDIIYALDKNGRFTFINSVVEKSLGYLTDDLIGRHYSSIVYEEDLEKARDLFEEPGTSGPTRNGEVIRLKAENGAVLAKHFEIRNVAMDLPVFPDTSPHSKYSGGRAVTHGVARDVSRRKQLEKQLQQADKMKAIGTLAGGLAHDFNNILMGIQAYTSLILLNNEVDSPDYERAQLIDRQVRSGAELTRQLLDLAKGSTKKARSIDLNELVQQSSRMFGRTKKEITIHENYQEAVWNIDAEPGQIEQALLNLYVNAWQAMEGGGDLTLETKNVSVDATQAKSLGVKTGDYVTISVSDTGVGMDEHTQKRVFEPFFTTKGPGQGTGLGLASVYGIMQYHSGAVTVNSVEHEGSTFRLYLPASKEAATRSERSSSKLLKGTETVLVVDDEEMVVNAEEEMLKALGYDVLTARSGFDAAEIYRRRQHDIALVVLDMIMPGIGGVQTFNLLRSIDPNIRVMIATGFSDDDEVSGLMQQGCRGFLQKPFNIERLSHKLREVLDTQPARPA